MDLKLGHDLKVEDLVDLYGSVGWTSYTRDPALLRLAIQKSAYVVSLADGGRLVALARCISDDATIMYLQDVLVRPSHQRLGLGTRLLKECLHRYQHVRQVVLLTDNTQQQAQFYRSLGLSNTKTFNDGALNAFVRFNDSSPTSP